MNRILFLLMACCITPVCLAQTDLGKSASSDQTTESTTSSSKTTKNESGGQDASPPVMTSTAAPDPGDGGGGTGVNPASISPMNDTGVRPYQTYAGAHEDIGLANGNLSLEIPLAGFPGRNGLNYKLALQYDSKIWSPHISYSNTGQDITFDWRYERRSYAIGQMGWKLNMPFVTNGDWVLDDNGNFSGGQTPYIIELPTGGKASVAYGSGVMDSEDGSFLSFEGGNTVATVTEKDGSKMFFDTGLITKLQDTNGNYISFSGNVNATTITDTLGRQITFTDGAASATVSYKDTSGTTRNIILTYSYLTLFQTTGNATTNQYFTGTTRFSEPVQHSGGTNQNYLWVNKPVNDQAYRLLTRIDFPDGTFYAFSYNGYGELIKVVYPTGGYTKYTYDAFENGAANWDIGGGVVGADFREITSKRVCREASGVCASEDVTTYAPSISTPLVNNSQVDIMNPLGEKTSIYFMNDTPDDPSLSLHSPKETSRQMFNAAGTLMKSVSTAYVPLEAGMGLALPSQIITTLYDISPPLVTESDITYDTYSAHVRWPAAQSYYQQTVQNRTRYIDNALSETIYDFGTSSHGALLRTSNTTWWKGLWAAHVWNRPLTEEVVGAGGNRSYSTFEYDNYTESLTATGATQHDSGYGTSYLSRGNQTAVSRYRNTDGAYLTTRHQYDDAGNVRKTTDPGGHATTVNYSSTFQSAYPTQVTLPTTGGVAHASSSNYNFDTGLKTSDTDQNGNITQYSYDLMLRPTEIDAPPNAGTTEHGQTNISYPNANTVIRSQKITSTSSATSYSYTDGLGRAIQNRSVDPQGDVFVDTTYDALGRASTVTNPYRLTTDPTYGITTTSYDALGRVRFVTLPDGGYTQESYSGNWHTSFDVAGKKRWLVSDALGRLIQVEEPDASGGGWGPGTSYTYDALSNLLSATQDGGSSDPGTWRVRSFTYNSLSQLITANNPETGTVCYGYWSGASCIAGYDNDGNMVGKTDARGVFTNYNPADSPIDALHRVTKKTFSDGTPSQTFTYDAALLYGVTMTNPVGRLSMTNAGNCAGCALYSYDKLGRITSLKQAVNNGAWYSSSAAYNLAGAMTSLTYPSGRVVNFGYDDAARLNDANAVLAGSAYHYYAVPSGGFLPSGAAATVNLGNTTQEIYALNNRLQPCHYQLKFGGTYYIDRSTFYSANSTACPASDTMMNAGNVNRVVDNLISGRTQTFAYDYLNRITSAHTTATTGADAWAQTFSYDAWGNMNQAGSLAFSQTFAANNRINSGAYTYDTSGDVTYDGTHHYAYDAEGQISSVDSGTTAYTYDANGERVRKTTGSNFTEYIYFGGEPIAEKDQAGIWTDYIFAGGKRIAMATGTASSETTYFHSDNLGSQRLMTNAAGGKVLDTERTYLPFGWEWNATTAGSHYRFTGKERDAETNNDYFGARYYNSSMGRWLSPDWSAAPVVIPYADMSDPQSLNLYGYVRNRPTFSVDADGHKTIAELTDLFQTKVDKAVSYLTTKAINSGSPSLAYAATLSLGMNGSQINGVADSFKAGSSVGGCLDSCNGTQMANAASQDLMRTAGLVDLANLAVGTTGLSGKTVAPRLPQDAGVNPVAPRANNGTGTVGRSPTQNALVQQDIAGARAGGASDIRVNQQQVNAQGDRVGINRPDLQYTQNGQRQYVEYDTSSSSRGTQHENRIRSNDPDANVTLKKQD